MSQAAAGCVQNQPRAEIPADQSHLLIEVRGCTRRETTARHDKLGRRRRVAKFGEALLLFDKRQARPRKHEPILQAGADLVDGEAFPRRAVDLDTVKRDSPLGEEIGVSVAGRPARGEDRRHRRAQVVGDLRNVDAAAAGVVTDTGAAGLLSRAHHVGIRGDIERRVHRQRDDRCSTRPSHDVIRLPGRVRR